MPSASDPRQQNRTAACAAPCSAWPAPAQPTQRSAELLLSVPPNSPVARPAQPAGGARFKQQARPAHAGLGNHAPRTSCSWLARRCSGHALGAITRMPAVASKRKLPVPTIIGGVIAVLCACRDRFVVPAVRGLLCRRGCESRCWPASYYYDSRWRLGDAIASILREPYRRRPQGFTRR